jgi:hypothetical protein
MESPARFAADPRSPARIMSDNPATALFWLVHEIDGERRSMTTGSATEAEAKR